MIKASDRLPAERYFYDKIQELVQRLGLQMLLVLARGACLPPHVYPVLLLEAKAGTVGRLIKLADAVQRYHNLSEEPL